MIFLEDAVVILNLLEERNSNAPQGSLKWVTRRSAAAGAVCKKRSLPQHTPPGGEFGRRKLRGDCSKPLNQSV